MKVPAEERRGHRPTAATTRQHPLGRRMAVLREVSLSEETLDAIEAQVKRRGADIAKAPEL